ncbi:MAG: phosphoribosyltransferase [Patescibacteria group bacterium]
MQTIPTIHFANSKASFIAPSWGQMNDLAFEIAKQAFAADERFDRIVTLAKGGWPMTRSLVDFLKVGKVASIGVKFYSGINERLPKPEIYQDIPVSVEGETVLLFDDVADTGESLKFVVDILRARGVRKVMTASLFYKPWSCLEPDFYGAETDAWIIFPYDLVESIDILGKKWRSENLGDTEILNRFKKLNFRQEWVEYYFEATDNSDSSQASMLSSTKTKQKKGEK